MAELIMVAGGSRSGKSTVAEDELASCQAPLYLATLEIGDGEMAERVKLHRQRRGERWTTVEAPHDLAQPFRNLPASTDGVLVDCLTGFLSNRFLKLDHDGEAQASAQTILEELAAACEAMEAAACERVVIVTNEVGCGVVPEHRLGRRFRDLQGWANQQLAAAADRVLLVQFGLTTRLK